ncbi:MAG: hypothetical protein FJY60_06360 [Betaproteobacteria bacterium]|nr:hypothetical protein [Betaproteobacteria bacterium]
MNASPADSDAPNCWQCRHCSVSWDPNLPYACRLMGFKSRIMPALEVLRADGSRCHGFSRKTASGISGVSDASTADQACALNNTSLSGGSSLMNGAASGKNSTTATTTASSAKTATSSKPKGLYSTFNKLA